MSELQLVLSRLEAIEKQNGETAEAVASVNVQVVRLCTTVEDAAKTLVVHDKLINGTNGTPGLRIDVDRLKQSHEDERKRGNRTAVAAWTAVGSFVVGLGFMGVKALVALFK